MPSRWENKEDMKKMQQDALKRVQEMQSKAKEKISQTTMTLEEKSSCSQEDKVLHKEKPKLTLNSNFHETDNLLKAITKDSERNLILMIILILMEEKSDSELLLSLMYLII